MRTSCSFMVGVVHADTPIRCAPLHYNIDSARPHNVDVKVVTDGDLLAMGLPRGHRRRLLDAANAIQLEPAIARVAEETAPEPTASTNTKPAKMHVTRTHTHTHTVQFNCCHSLYPTPLFLVVVQRVQHSTRGNTNACIRIAHCTWLCGLR